MATIRAQALRRSFQELFDVPVMTNIIRGAYVEQLVVLGLGDSWRSTPVWANWDAEHPDGWSIEIRQSAKLQDWHGAYGGQTAVDARPKFSIAPRTGFWSRDRWVEARGRAADIYVFAAHTETDRRRADQRDPEQWTFYIIPEIKLPDQKTMTLSRVAATARPLAFDRIAGETRSIMAELGAPKRPSDNAARSPSL